MEQLSYKGAYPRSFSLLFGPFSISICLFPSLLFGRERFICSKLRPGKSSWKGKLPSLDSFSSDGDFVRISLGFRLDFAWISFGFRLDSFSSGGKDLGCLEATRAGVTSLSQLGASAENTLLLSHCGCHRFKHSLLNTIPWKIICAHLHSSII